MLTVLECIKGKQNSMIKKHQAKILNELYTTILDNASMKKTSGGIIIDSDNDVIKAYRDLREFDYNIKRYTQIGESFVEDGELVIEYNLEGFENE